MSEYDKHVERKAIAAFVRFNGLEPENGDYYWNEMATWVERHRWLGTIRATMETDRAAGYALVPRAKTKAMREAAANRCPDGWDIADDIVDAAIAAGDILKGDG